MLCIRSHVPVHQSPCLHICRVWPASNYDVCLTPRIPRQGEVLGITRFGIARMKDSVLMLASLSRPPTTCLTGRCMGAPTTSMVCL